MTLLEQIQKTFTPEQIAEGNFHTIVAGINVGYTVPKPTTIGAGAILDTLGLAAGNAFLDVIDNAPEYRHVKKIIDRGEFDMSKPLSQAGVQAMVGAGVLTQPQADALKALGTTPATVTWEQCREAIQTGV